MRSNVSNSNGVNSNAHIFVCPLSHRGVSNSNGVNSNSNFSRAKPKDTRSFKLQRSKF